MKYFTFSFILNLQRLPLPERPSPTQSQGLSDVTFLGPLHFMHTCLSVCPLIGALPKDRAHIYVILHGYWVPSTMPDTK